MCRGSKGGLETAQSGEMWPCTADAAPWKQRLSGDGCVWDCGGSTGEPEEWEAGGAGRQASTGVKSRGGGVAQGTVEPLS